MLLHNNNNQLLCCCCNRYSSYNCSRYLTKIFTLCYAVQVLDIDGSGAVSGSEFCQLLKKLVIVKL